MHKVKISVIADEYSKCQSGGRKAAAEAKAKAKIDISMAKVKLLELRVIRMHHCLLKMMKMVLAPTDEPDANKEIVAVM